MATADEWDLVMQLVAQLSPTLVAELLLAVSELGGEDWVAEVAALIADNNANGVLAHIFPLENRAALRTPFTIAIRTIAEEIGPDMAAALPALIPPIGPAVSFRFDALDPRIVKQIERQGMTINRTFTENTLNGIKQHLLAGIKRGVNPREIARTLHADAVVGLSARGSLAVTNYRALLQGTDRTAILSAALKRELRDRRYDPLIERSIKNRSRLPAEKIDEMVKRYSARMLRHELETLARTETLQAHEMVKREMWKDTIERGYIDPKAYVQKWYVAKDERTCKICMGIAAVNKNGVPVGGLFLVPNGAPLEGPLAHPNCRCITLVTRKKK